MYLLRLLACISVLFASTAFADPTVKATTVTISVPKAVVWVDPTGAGVAPVDGGGYYNAPLDSSYFDAAGNRWRLNGVTTAAPTASGYWGPNNPAALWYQTTNCTGTAYLVLDTFIQASDVIQTESGFVVRPPALVSVTTTLNSKLFGGVCTLYTIVVPGTFIAFRWSDMVLVGPAPTLPAGPYHIEYR